MMRPYAAPKRSALAALALAFALAGCAASTSGPSTAAPTMSPADSTPSGGEPSLPTGEVPTEALEEVVAEGASRAGVERGAVQVKAAEAVTWRDGSLGCPEPGMVYTQALVPGYRVVLEIDGEELHFHAPESGDFRFCADPQPPLEGGADR